MLYRGAKGPGWAGFSLMVLSLWVSLTGCSPPISAPLGVDEIQPEELQRLLASPHPPLLVDVTTPNEFVQEGHIPGSISAPLDQLGSLKLDLGSDQEKLVVTVCQGGFRSALAASKLKGHGLKQVRSLSGGKRRWASLGYFLEKSYPSTGLVPGDTGRTLVLSFFEQGVVVVSAYVFKPTYMLVSLLLVLFLFRNRNRESALIRAGFGAFFAGELFCAVNFLCAGGVNLSLDILHGLGMVAMGVLVPWGAFILADERMLGLTKPEMSCVLKRFCGRCWKQEQVSCVVHRLFMFVAPVLAFLSLLPWTAPLRDLERTGLVFGHPVAYSYSLILQMTDFRLYPLVGTVCLVITSLFLFRGRQSIKNAQPFFFIGFGFTSFAMFRLFLLSAYREVPFWSDFWEEATEFFITVITTSLVFLYRENLGLKDKKMDRKEKGA